MIACPTGGADVAHQIVNTGSVAMRYLAVSNRTDLDACEYPDSGKISIVSDQPGTMRKMFRAETGVGYYDGEEP